MRKILIKLLYFFLIGFSPLYSKNDLYEKIDLFGEVLENINKDYVEEVDQAEIMDSAINGVLQSLDPYSAYMSPELFKEMETDMLSWIKTFQEFLKWGSEDDLKNRYL